ncbi:MAG: small multi-drug export protein [Clostridia bacterium]|nr:small multi-drug export protein [Clostridia bacterium]
MSFWTTTAGIVIKTFLISMVPVIELRGAVPVAIHDGLNIWAALFISIIGNLLPVPFIILFVRNIFAFLRKHFSKLNGVITKLEKRAEKKSETVLKYAFWGLFVLVAIPLPGTGAWTGALVAAMLDMRLKKAFPSIALGVVAAGLIMTILSLTGKAIF